MLFLCGIELGLLELGWGLVGLSVDLHFSLFIWWVFAGGTTDILAVIGLVMSENWWLKGCRLLFVESGGELKTTSLPHKDDNKTYVHPYLIPPVKLESKVPTIHICLVCFVFL